MIDEGDFINFLRSRKFTWLQFAWVLWTNIRHVAILRIPWCLVVAVVKLIWLRKWENPIVFTSSGRQLAIFGKRELKNQAIRERAVDHPELKEGNDCTEVAKDTYKMGIYGMSFVCNGSCKEKVKQALAFGKSWFYEGPQDHGKVEGFYELTYEIKNKVYVVEEISQLEFVRKIVESKGRSQLESTDWWVTGRNKPHELIFRSRWSMLKTDSRLYGALPIVPIFLNTQYSKEVASIAFMILITVDLFLPLTSTILNCARYFAKTRLQMLISRISRCKVRQAIFDILTGFRPGMKPCLDKFHKVVRLKAINIIVWPRENPVCYPFACGDEKCVSPAEELPECHEEYILEDGSIRRYWEWKLPDMSTIKYWRKDREKLPPKSGGLIQRDSISLPNGYNVMLETTKRDFDGLPSHDGPRANGDSHLTGDEPPLTSLREDYVVTIKVEEAGCGKGELEPLWNGAQYEDDTREISLEVWNHEETLVWQGENLKYTKEQRRVLEYYLKHIDTTFSVEACNSRFWGKEFCVQPKFLYDTLDDIRTNPQCRLMYVEGNFLVGPSIPNRSRLFRL